MIYNSNRYFTVLGYTAAHGSLFLRSQLMHTDMEDYSSENAFNIDIEFWGVCYFDLSTAINGVVITEVSRRIPLKVGKYLNKAGNKVYEIKTDGSVLYIVAAGFLVGTNGWLNRSRLTDSKLNYDKIIAQSKR